MRRRLPFFDNWFGFCRRVIGHIVISPTPGVGAIIVRLRTGLGRVGFGCPTLFFHRSTILPRKDFYFRFFFLVTVPTSIPIRIFHIPSLSYSNALIPSNYLLFVVLCREWDADS